VGCWCSEHEGEGGVAEAVADVEAAENGCVAPMICVVAGPELAAQHDEAARAVALNRPAALRLIRNQGVQEIVVEDVHLTVLQRFLVILLDRAQVLPSREFAGLVRTQAAESLVEEDLAGGDALGSAAGQGRASVADLMHDDGEAVELGQVLRGQHDASRSVDHLGCL